MLNNQSSKLSGLSPPLCCIHLTLILLTFQCSSLSIVKCSKPKLFKICSIILCHQWIHQHEKNSHWCETLMVCFHQQSNETNENTPLWVPTVFWPFVLPRDTPNTSYHGCVNIFMYCDNHLLCTDKCVCTSPYILKTIRIGRLLRKWRQSNGASVRRVRASPRGRAARVMCGP